MESSPAFWIVSDPALLGANVAGLRAPDAATALVIDGFATEDGQRFDYPPFEAGRQDAIFVVLGAEVGEKVYAGLAAYVAGRVSTKENVVDENEVLAARWSLPNGQVAVMAADSGGSEHAQDALERVLALHKMHLQRSDMAIIAPQFDAPKILATGQGILNPAAGEALASLLTATPAPAPARRKPAG